MRVAVIGAGAMGALVAMLLCDAGEDVVVYDADEEKAAAAGDGTTGDSGNKFAGSTGTGAGAAPGVSA